MLGIGDLFDIMHTDKIRHRVVQYLEHGSEVFQSLNQLLVGSQLLLRKVVRSNSSNSRG